MLFKGQLYFVNVSYSTRLTVPLEQVFFLSCFSVLFIAAPLVPTIVFGIHEMLSKSLLNACQKCGFFSLSPPKADLLCFSHSKPCS